MKDNQMETGQASNGTPTAESMVESILAKQQARLNPVQATEEEVQPDETADATPEEASAEAVEGGEPDEAGDDTGTDEEEGQEEETITFKVNGKPITKSLSEAQDLLASGYELQRIRNSILDEQRQIGQVRETVIQAQQAYAAKLQEIAAFEASRLPSQQQMQEMLNNGDTQGYLKAEAAHKQAAHLKQMQQQAQGEAKAAQEALEVQAAKAMVEEVKAANPAFANPDHWTVNAKFLEQSGFSAEEVGNFVDARVWLMVDEYRRLKEQTANKSAIAKKVLAGAKPLKPTGRVQEEPADKRVVQLKQSFAKAPNPELGVELIKARLAQRTQG